MLYSRIGMVYRIVIEIFTSLNNSKMKVPAGVSSITVNVIAYLYVLLFVYAAIGKLLDFENFQIQLGQSPLLSAFAGFVSVSVILSEIIIALLLVIPSSRRIGLYAAFCLMVLFTVYIFIILNYSPFVPCSCGGILEDMGWTEHLIFNVVFILLAVCGIWLYTFNSSSPPIWYGIAGNILILSVSCVGLMTILFAVSEDIVHHRNNFVRRFPPSVVSKIAEMDLDYNSYYFAGENAGKVYLGNMASPSWVAEIDSSLKSKKSYHIEIQGKVPSFKAVQIRVLPPYFYVLDGYIPCIFQGKINDWKAKLKSQGSEKFAAAEVIDSNAIGFRSISRTTGEHVLGKMDLGNVDRITFQPELLQKQIDGIFDTDGMLHYSKGSKRFVYIYFYRNQYIVTDHNLSLQHRGNTIDTTSHAKLKIAYVKNRDQKKLSAPPLIVNRKSAVYNSLLFVNSDLPGKYEPLSMWRDASIIDVYNIDTRSYLMSFYVYKIKGEQLRSFTITDTHLFALVGNNVVAYKFDKQFRKTISASKYPSDDNNDIPAGIRNPIEHL